MDFFLLKASFKYLYTASHIIMEQYSYTLLFTSKDIWPCFPVIDRYKYKDFKQFFIFDPSPPYINYGLNISFEKYTSPLSNTQALGVS